MIPKVENVSKTVKLPQNRVKVECMITIRLGINLDYNMSLMALVLYSSSLLTLLRGLNSL